MTNKNENEHDNGKEIELPEFVNEVKKDTTFTRAELELKTGKELAKMAEPLQNKYSYSTLKGKSKPYLIDIILGITKEEDLQEQPKGRAPQSTNQSEEILNITLGLFQGFKQQREGEDAQLNPIATQMFKDSAITQVDKAQADGVLKFDKFNTAILGLSATALIIDGVIGFKNVPGLFSKLKSKLGKKAA